MVQRKVLLNKLGIQANTSPNKTDKKQALDITKPSLQYHDGKTKGTADLKSIKMKKSRSLKRSDIEFRLRSSPEVHDVPRQPGKPPPMVTPTKTPSPKKPSYSKSPYSSPNYMRSTSSSEARKENPSKESVSSTSKLHKVGRILSRTSSLKKVRTLTKAPSFKHTRTGANKKLVLCENLDVQRSTCSSTLKDSKFPRYLTLAPGATEAQGTSVMKVCPYNYCSLNGHHHSPAPPLKCFLSSRRKLLKTQKAVKPEVPSPGNRKPSGNKVKKGDPEVAVVFSGMPKMAGNENEGFFVEIYAPGREVAAANDVTMEPEPAKFSEKLSSGPCSEIDFQDEDASFLDMNFGSENSGEEDCQSTDVENQTAAESCDSGSDADVDSVSTVSFNQIFVESSDMEWEEGVIPDFQEDKTEILVQKECGFNQDEPDFKLEKFLVEEFLPYFQDEIVEYIRYSDADSVPDSESIDTDEEHTKETVTDEEQDEWTSGPQSEIVEVISKLEELTEQPGRSLQNTNDEVLELDSLKKPDEKDGYEWNGEDYTEEDREGSNVIIVMEEQQLSESTIEETPSMAEVSQNISAGEEIPMADSNNYVRNSSSYSEEQNNSDEVKLHSNENCAVETEEPDMEDISKREENEEESPAIGNESQLVKKINSHGGNDSSEELIDHCNKLKRSIRCKKEHEQDDKAREFNPRAPNFLPVEPDPEAEKVDLRHQEMDERRNSEEWMLDHALQKTVNQLAPARKRKVALLVEAFEAVLPTPKYEPHMRRNSSGFSHPRQIQICS